MKHIFLLNSTMLFKKNKKKKTTDIIYLHESLWNSLLEKKILDNRARFRAIWGFAMYGSAFWVFSATERNVLARTRVAFQCATDARTINAFYGRNSHFLCFGENLSQSLMEKNVKFVQNDVKATAFSSSKRRDILRASIIVSLASQSNVARNAA